MTQADGAAPKPQKAAQEATLKKPRPVWFVTLMAFVLPGSGQVFNGAPARGVIMQFGMVFGGFITYQLTTPEISPSVAWPAACSSTCSPSSTPTASPSGASRPGSA